MSASTAAANAQLQQTMNRVQAATGMALLPFTALHLVGHIIAGHSSLGNSYLLAVRELYQNPVMETAGAACLVAHIACGVFKAIFVRKRRLNARMGSFAWFTRVSGLVLGLSMVGHIYNMRIKPLLAWGDSSLIDYSFLMFLRTHSGVGITAYMMVLGSAGVIHGINGTRSAIARLRQGRALPEPSLGWSLVTKAGVAAMCSAALGVTGYYSQVPVPSAEWFASL